MHRSHSQAGGRNIPLSALGGGEGRGEVGDPRRSEQRRPHLTLPSPRIKPAGLRLTPRRVPPSPPGKRAERGKTLAQRLLE